MRQRIRQPETRLMAEYLAKKVYPNWYRQRQPLGPPLPGTVEELGMDAALRHSRPWRLEVDAVAVEDGKLVLVEGKVFKIVDGMAKLPLYGSLVSSTPELEEHRGKRVVLRLVAPWTSESMETMARAAGVEVVVFQPEWIVDYVHQYHDYWTREHRELRELRREMLTALGLE